MPFEYLPIIYSVIGGFGWAMLAFFREYQKTTTSFEWKKLLKTLIIGAGVGFIAQWYGLTFDAVQSMTIFGSITAVADKIVNIIFGFLSPKKKK